MESLPQEYFTCWRCKVKFIDLNRLKHHYHTDWHRYNMSTVTNGLASITLEDFEKKEAMYREISSTQTKQKQICEVCRKKFNNQKQYENHLASKTHKKKLEQKDTTITYTKKSSSIQDISNKNIDDCLNIETDSDVESVDSDEWFEDSKYQITYEYCLFCDYHNKSIECIMIHMEKKHSFFVPYLEYCIDLGGLLKYLEHKICTEFKCIWCNDSGRKMQSKEAVRMHMIDKGHCKMLFEEKMMHEYSSFYNYLSSYPDAESADPDEELSDVDVLDDEGYVMKLPSGKLIAHRDLAHYYKQNLSNEVACIIKEKEYPYSWRKELQKHASVGSMEKRLHAARITAKDNQNFQRVQAKHLLQLQVKQNNLQKHFRRQTDF
ncbi:PREDICTED: zinc finger protein 622 [Cyphomyrmex costatus]|uniref:C2H2-type domain-containing protein n=1 Tax=Cyphomyrmex costatus TaxID=456900 RepID=A0A195CM10_9HYME|nr:PREDICTED: zinc finger protein 622 [Cyphomyrmex costatus]KYN01743.1 hypothetical protein ALC62_07421 [Cyphomyrmex costatus]